VRQHLFKSNNTIEVLQSGEPYFNRLIQLIESAKHSIHIQVYIFDYDNTGLKVLAQLIAARQRGVQVYLIVDAYASQQFTAARVAELQRVGLHVKLFAPYNMYSLKVGRRLHHKLILIDEHIALIGGINIADKYSGFNGSKPWLDAAVQVEGNICSDVLHLCLALWPKRKRKKMQHQHSPLLATNGLVKLRLLQNDWWRRKIEISRAYRDAIRHAKQDLTLVASYFLPGYRKRKLLQQAMARGVKVTFIFGAVSDIPFIRAANHFLYALLLKQGATIYEWQPSVLHAKFAFADDKWSTVGSYNLNALSDYGSLEANIEVMNEDFNKHMRLLVKNLITEGCLQINAEQFLQQNRPWIQAYRWCCYQLMRVSLFVLFALMKRDRLKL
jgi:cardiolipin synthase A/B